MTRCSPHSTRHSSLRAWSNCLTRSIEAPPNRGTMPPSASPFWPQQRLTVPSRQERVCRPWSDFPPGLLADVDAYLDRAAGLDLSDDDFTRAQRPATLVTRRWQMQRLATAIVESGVPIEELTNLEAMLTPER